MALESVTPAMETFRGPGLTRNDFWRISVPM